MSRDAQAVVGRYGVQLPLIGSVFLLGCAAGAPPAAGQADATKRAVDWKLQKDAHQDKPGREGLTQAELRDAVRTAIDNEAVQVMPAVFRANSAQRTLRYEAGSMTKIAPVPHDRDAIDVAVQAQARIELLRRAVADAKEDAFWGKRFDEAERIVSRMLGDVHSGKLNAEELVARADANRRRIDTLLREGAQEFAAERGLQMSSTTSLPSLSVYEVTLVTLPAGKKIQCVHALDYELAELQGEQPRWEYLGISPVKAKLLGRYRFEVDDKVLKEVVAIRESNENLVLPG